MTASKPNAQRRSVPGNLIETTPAAGGLGNWLLASPLLLFLLWAWGDLVAYLSPLPLLLDWAIGILIYVLLLVLPLGVAAFWLVTSLPKLFHHAGWDVQPLERIAPEEEYTVRFTYRDQIRAQTTWRRTWMRAAQGWVFLEIAAIFIGAIAMIPIFLSVSEFGFGQ